jgi:hypothetical protein
MPKKNSKNKLKNIPYELLLSENFNVCDVYLKDFGTLTINAFAVEISTSNIFFLTKKGTIIEKTIIPIENIIMLKQYYIDFSKKEPIVSQETIEEKSAEIEKDIPSIGLLGREGRKLAKKQFRQALKLKDTDYIKPEDLEIEEETEEKKEAVITGEQLLQSSIKEE